MGRSVEATRRPSAERRNSLGIRENVPSVPLDFVPLDLPNRNAPEWYDSIKHASRVRAEALEGLNEAFSFEVLEIVKSIGWLARNGRPAEVLAGLYAYETQLARMARACFSASQAKCGRFEDLCFSCRQWHQRPRKFAVMVRTLKSDSIPGALSGPRCADDSRRSHEVPMEGFARGEPQTKNELQRVTYVKGGARSGGSL